MKKLLVAVDFSDVTDRVIESALELALNLKSTVTLLHILEPEPEFLGYEPGVAIAPATKTQQTASQQTQLDSLKATFTAEGIMTEEVLVQGPAIDKILSEAEERRVDMIVMGSHGHGALYNLLVGSITEGVLKGSQSPVLVVPAVKK